MGREYYLFNSRYCIGSTAFLDKWLQFGLELSRDTVDMPGRCRLADARRSYKVTDTILLKEAILQSTVSQDI